MNRFTTTMLLTLSTLAVGCIPEVATEEGGGALGSRTATGPSARDGMGPQVYPGGTAFRAWAPNATRVFVTGDFNAWSDSATELVSEKNGNFSADVPGAIAGQEYQYVIYGPAGKVFRADPRAPQMTSSVGNSVITDPAAYHWSATSFQTPGFREQVIYEMHIGTFQDTPGGMPGTFASALDGLDHLEDLGVNMIELLPPNEFAGDFSWGYNTSFPFAPESAYGTPEDAKTFIDEAHARGIGVIIDVVHNHHGPGDLATWCFDGECYGEGNGGIYFYTGDRRESGWGPRPDFGRPEVRDYIQDSAMSWLREYRADGLRWDSTVNIRRANGADLPDGWNLLRRINDAVDREMPWKIMIAEDLQNDAGLTRATGAGGAGFDSQWDGGFFHPIDEAIIAADDGSRDMWSVRDAIAHQYDGSATQRVIYTESHDEVANGKQRIPSMIWADNPTSYYSQKRSTLGAAIVMTSPGIPMIFQGQEILEDGWFQDSDPVDWTKLDRFAGIRDLYRDLIHLRRNSANQTRGLQGDNVNVFHVNDTDKVIAFHRWDRGGAGDDVVVIANFSSRAFRSYDLGLPRGGTWKVRFNSDWRGYSSAFDGTESNDLTAWSGGRDGLGYHGTAAIGAYSVVILSQ